MTVVHVQRLLSVKSHLQRERNEMIPSALYLEQQRLCEVVPAVGQQVVVVAQASLTLQQFAPSYDVSRCDQHQRRPPPLVGRERGACSRLHEARVVALPPDRCVPCTQKHMRSCEGLISNQRSSSHGNATCMSFNRSTLHRSDLKAPRHMTSRDTPFHENASLAD